MREDYPINNKASEQFKFLKNETIKHKIIKPVSQSCSVSL